MKGDPLPADDHIARFCKKSRVFTDGIVASSAFELRPGEEYVSVGWLEKYDGIGRGEQIEKLRAGFANYLKYKSGDKFALVNVGTMVDFVREYTESNRTLRVLHEPMDRNEGHSGIYDTAEGERTITVLIAKCIAETVEAKTP